MHSVSNLRVELALAADGGVRVALFGIDAANLDTRVGRKGGGVKTKLQAATEISAHAHKQTKRKKTDLLHVGKSIRHETAVAAGVARCLFQERKEQELAKLPAEHLHTNTRIPPHIPPHSLPRHCTADTRGRNRPGSAPRG